MSGKTGIDARLRERIIAEPQVLLDDMDVMTALVGANDQAMGSNVIDLRGIAMDRLTARLDRLEDTHRTVIAAAYDNLAGTNQIHRAVLRLLDAARFEEFLQDLRGDVAEILRVDAVRLVVETATETPEPSVARLSDLLFVAPQGFVAGYISPGKDVAARQVVLRQVPVGGEAVYGEAAARIQSEACLRLDLGQDRLPGLLALGAADPQQFTPQQGTDLLAFLAGCVERAMRRWLA